MEEMASRISGLEKSLAQATNGQKTSARRSETSTSEHTDSPSALSSARKTRSAKLRAKGREDVLVQEGSSSQYFNGILLTRVLEEVGPCGRR